MKYFELLIITFILLKVIKSFVICNTLNILFFIPKRTIIIALHVLNISKFIEIAYFYDRISVRIFQKPHTRHFTQKFLSKFYRSSPKTEIYIRSAEEKNTPAFPQHGATFDTNYQRYSYNIISHVLTRLSDEILNLQPVLRLLNKVSR